MMSSNHSNHLSSRRFSRGLVSRNRQRLYPNHSHNHNNNLSNNPPHHNSNGNGSNNNKDSDGCYSNGSVLLIFVFIGVIN